MKNAIIVFAMLIGFTAMAQKEGLQKNARETRQQMTPEQIATLQTKKMTLALDLSPAQEKQLMTLNLKAAKERSKKMQERKASKAKGEEAKLSAEQGYDLRTEMLDRKIAHQRNLKTILSPEQFSTWQKMARKGHSKRRKARGHSEGHKERGDHHRNGNHRK
ncbi:protein of unknown function [Arenibacter nanhaiticus]|uniref:LTXXQ motif family protein n=1 Tax=Arenibacter nanhaiticus TaxID=558155 RepID=A0A1M6FFJ2_9FLAO|nr:DUF4890 domain-containing protein [Arenibacter nanhaiticus]SHI96491.1 protein of unknown function [Arenibacter nanhaiticus]